MGNSKSTKENPRYQDIHSKIYCPLNLPVSVKGAGNVGFFCTSSFLLSLSLFLRRKQKGNKGQRSL